jgi:DNA polymerase I-like protein with 3'-5' exonuclease and polymerase domains
MNILTFDLETTTKKSYGRKANPLDLDNKIVAIGLKYYNPGCDERDLGRASGLLGLYKQDFPKNWLSYVDVIVGHNIKFDLLYIWKRDDLQQWFKEGGQIWDTSLAHYILSGQQETYPQLRDIATRCYGCKSREKKMEKFWEKEIDTKDIPEKLVIEDVKNDVIDTETILFKQIQLAKQKGMTRLIHLQMDALLATTEMEFNGMYVDKGILLQNKEIVKETLEDRMKEFLELIKPYWIKR